MIWARGIRRGVGSGVGDGSGDEMAAIESSGLGVYTQPSDVLSAVGVEYAGNVSQGGAGPAQRARLVPAVGPNEASEKAVARALKWLANHQLADGGWSFNHASCEACRGACRNPGRLEGARNAATALALLPFLGSGQTHKDSKRYKSAINGGLNYLISHMRVGPHGGALNEPGGNMYSHGIAAIALCEAYAMTHDKKLLVPAGAAINFICYAQDPAGGGWRDQPRETRRHVDARMAGHGAEERLYGGADRPADTVRKASQFLDSVQSDERRDIRLSGRQRERRHYGYRLALPDVSRLEKRQPHAAARRPVAQPARPLGQQPVLQLLCHPGDAALGRRGMEEVEPPCATS